MESLGNRLLRRMNELNLKASDLSKRTGVSGSTISLYISGKRTPSIKVVVKLAQALECGTDYLLTGREPEPPEYEKLREILERAIHAREPLIRDATSAESARFGPIPILPYAQAGLRREEGRSYPLAEEHECIEWTSDVRDPDAYVLRAEGDNMAPKIEEGECLLVCPSLEVRSGNIAVVRTTADEVMVNKVVFKGNMVLLQSINPAHEPRILAREDLKFIQKVVYVKLK